MFTYAKYSSLELFHHVSLAAESLRKNLSQPTVEERREGEGGRTERSPSESGVTHTEV